MPKVTGVVGMQPARMIVAIVYIVASARRRCRRRMWELFYRTAVCRMTRQSLVEGQPLNEMARGTKLTTEAVTRFGVQIADALAHAHDRQIVHRDLKGANVVITHDGRVKVLGFGLARRLDKEAVDAVTRMQASVEGDRAIVGTLPYMAPEVLTGETGGYQSDIWALGVLLYEAAKGQL
jgi:serine/threonine protein kinase